ncbi:MAG: PASTA domain-containing protein [Ginsengibacter sp.]
MFKFIARQPFIVNLLVAIIAIFLVAFLFFESLGWLTNHGSYLKVPSVIGMKTNDAIKQLENQGFEVIITDSAFDDNLPLNTVKKQLPDQGSTVKVNRTVFLNVNPYALPMIEMPKLEGLSYRFAVDKLLKSNLKLGDTTMRPDFMKGSVLDQLFNGKKVEPGTKLIWGSSVSLVVGAGVEAVQIPVPDLVGLTVTQAKEILTSQGIVLASILTSGRITDTANAFVFKQNPDVLGYEKSHVYIQPGQTMDIWIQIDKPVLDSTQNKLLAPGIPQTEIQ